MKSARIIILIFVFLFPSTLAAAVIDATIDIIVCGNNIREGVEECDNSDLNGRTCQSFGYSSGSLSCRPSCEYNASACTNASGGGGGGGSIITPTQLANVVFSGRAYPKSKVTILKDSQIAVTQTAGEDSDFRIELSGITAGSYVFSFWSEDSAGRRSLSVNFPISLIGNSTTNATGIFIPPTIGLSKTEVVPGGDLALFGQSYPESEIEVYLDANMTRKTNADAMGDYRIMLDPSQIKLGQHAIKTRSIHNKEASAFGTVLNFKIIGPDEASGLKDSILSAPMVDINNDSKVNLQDYSILAYWYERPGAPASIDFNKDGKVNLNDFSILAYHWTG